MNCLLLSGSLSLVWAAAPVAQVQVQLVAAPGNVTLHPGRTSPAYLYNSQLPGPVLRVTEGQSLKVRVRNLLPEPTTVHWHGVPVPLGMDGVPGITRPPVESGQEFTYEFVARPAGTYFFHPHVGLQLDQGLYGILIVDPATPGDPPYDRELIVVLDDWNTGGTTWLINGKSSLGQTPLTVRTGERVRIRFINVSVADGYVVALDRHPMTVTHTDGQRVQPVAVQAIPIGPGERYDILVQANQPGLWSLAAAGISNRNVTLVRAILAYEGAAGTPPDPAYVPPFLSSGTLLSYAMLASAGPVPPIRAIPDRVHDLTLSGGMMGQPWMINGQSWPNASPLPVAAGEAVRFNLTNRTVADHPMHLHGHFFRLLNTAGGTTQPVVKDTILIRGGMGNGASVEWLADNPGGWMFHCHNLYHAEGGMMRLVQYINSDADADGVQDGMDWDPLSAYPVLSTSSSNAGYRYGTGFSLDTQWRVGEAVATFLGLPLEPGVPLGLLGTLSLGVPVHVGSAMVGSSAFAAVPVEIPNDQALVGVRAGFQALATHAVLAPGVRLSTLAIVNVR